MGKNSKLTLHARLNTIRSKQSISIWRKTIQIIEIYLFLRKQKPKSMGSNIILQGNSKMNQLLNSTIILL